MWSVKLVALAGAVALLGGCFIIGSGRGSTVDAVPDEMKRTRLHVPDIDDAYPYGHTGLKPGQWAKFAVRREAGDLVMRIGVVKADGDKLWIEVVEETDVRAASARLVGPDGIVSKALYREVGPAGASDILPQKIAQRAETDPAGVGEETVEAREIEFLGAKRKAAIVKVVHRDEALGRSETEETVWCDVPGLYASSKHGGLGKRTSEREKLTVEMIEHGDGYVPVIPDPK